MLTGRFVFEVRQTKNNFNGDYFWSDLAANHDLGRQNLGGGLIEPFPDLIEPSEVFGLHHDGAEAGDGASGMTGKGVGWKETERQAGESEVKIEARGLIEDALGEDG